MVSVCYETGIDYQCHSNKPLDRVGVVRMYVGLSCELGETKFPDPLRLQILCTIVDFVLPNCYLGSKSLLKQILEHGTIRGHLTYLSNRATQSWRVRVVIVATRLPILCPCNNKAIYSVFRFTSTLAGISYFFMICDPTGDYFNT